MFKRKAEKAKASLLRMGYEVSINDKSKGKPEGWKKGSFIVSVQGLDGTTSEPVKFLGLVRPFQDLRDCEVDQDCERSVGQS